MALSKKPVNGMKDILPELTVIRMRRRSDALAEATVGQSTPGCCRLRDLGD